MRFFSRKVFVGRLLTANCKESLLGSIIFTPFPLSICQLLRLLPCGSGCKSTLFIFTLQIFLPLFLWISFECYNIVTQVTYTLLFKWQNFFSFFVISLTSVSFFSPISLKRADLLDTTGWLNRYWELFASLLRGGKLVVMNRKTRYWQVDNSQ